jgi:hypothetical protein
MVRVAIHATGVCHSDLSVVNGTIPSAALCSAWPGPARLPKKCCCLIKRPSRSAKTSPGTSPRWSAAVSLPAWAPDGLISKRAKLDGINQAFDDMKAGRVIRTVVEV